MDGDIIAEERAYWEREPTSRRLAVKESVARGDQPHLLAGAELRLKEALERLKAMDAA